MLGIPVALSVFFVAVVAAQSNSWPHDYPGKPSTPFGPDWQEYFRVKDPLPNVTWPLSRQFAGNIPVDRPGHPNNTLFFWGVEHRNGSLTGSTNDTEPWGIWLNGGPGSSSLLGFGFENGPFQLSPRGERVAPNNYTWANLADYFWIDQPVSVGWSTADEDGNVHDEDEMGRDFMGFLSNLVEVFPSLKTRPLYLTGESYAGTYIPYIMKTYFGTEKPPVNIAAFAIGNGVIGNEVVYFDVPAITIVETYPQLIDYDPAVFEYLREQEHLCGYDLNLTYPQVGGTFPTLKLDPPPGGSLKSGKTTLKRRHSVGRLLRSVADSVNEQKASSNRKRQFVPPTSNGTINPEYGCDLFDEALHYALDNVYPWTDPTTHFTYYDVPDGLATENQLMGDEFFNDARVRAAVHAPTSKDWSESIGYSFRGSEDGNDPSPEPMVFLTELAANASNHGVRVIIYSGNDDALVSHRGSEVVIQNTTFGGIQGFTRKPSTPWYDDDGQLAGIVRQERNWTYVLVKDAGHLVPYNSPERGFVLFRDFILGNSDTGLVITSENGTVSVVGGEDPALAGNALLGQPGIFLGTGIGEDITTTGTYTFPAATVAAWESYIATATATASFRP